MIFQNLYCQLFGPVNLDNLNQFKFSVVFSQKHPNWCETLFIPLVSSRASILPWFSSLFIFSGSSSSNCPWMPVQPMLFLSHFPYWLLIQPNFTPRFVYPIVYFPLGLKGPSHTVCLKLHIVSKPTPPLIFCFWLIASPSTQISALCLPSYHTFGW